MSYFAAVRVARIKTVAQLQGQSRHAMRLDEISQSRLRPGAKAGTCLAWSKDADADPRDLMAAFKAHKRATGAGERKGAPLILQTLCIISPDWIREAGDLHDPKNARNVALKSAAQNWAEAWAGQGSVLNVRLDLDENGGGVVDLAIAPIRLSRGKPQISTNKALQELKTQTGDRNEYAALQTSWAQYAAQHLSPDIQRGTPKTVTGRQNLSPETYGVIKDETRQEVLADLDELATSVNDERATFDAQVALYEQHRAKIEAELRATRQRLDQEQVAINAEKDRLRQLMDKGTKLVRQLELFVPDMIVPNFRRFLQLSYNAFKKIGWFDKDGRYTDVAPANDRKVLQQSAESLEAIMAAKEFAELEDEWDEELDDDDYSPRM